MPAGNMTRAKGKPAPAEPPAESTAAAAIGTVQPPELAALRNRARALGCQIHKRGSRYKVTDEENGAAVWCRSVSIVADHLDGMPERAHRKAAAAAEIRALTTRIKKRRLKKGNRFENWQYYFDYRAAYPTEVEPLDETDLEYVRQWTLEHP